MRDLNPSKPDRVKSRFRAIRGVIARHRGLGCDGGSGRREPAVRRVASRAFGNLDADSDQGWIRLVVPVENARTALARRRSPRDTFEEPCCRQHAPRSLSGLMRATESTPDSCRCQLRPPDPGVLPRRACERGVSSARAQFSRPRGGRPVRTHRMDTPTASLEAYLAVVPGV